MFQIEEPIIYPELKKQALNLDDYIMSQPSIRKLGSYAFELNHLRKKSIYKQLLNTKKDQYSQAMRQNRNRYLKNLVKSNSFYFPKELELDEYKKPKEDKFSRNLKLMEEIAQKEKNKSRKNSNFTNWRKESSFLDNKRKRTESIYEEINKKKNNKKKKKEEKDENLENDEEENYNEENENDDGEVSYKDMKEYEELENDDSQNYNYSDDEEDYY